MTHPPSPSAEVLALEILGFLAEAQAPLDRFVAESGISFSDLRARASAPDFLAAVMDFLLAHEDLAREFCTTRSLSAETLHRARRRLPGT
jgi:hypothetical protein